MQARHFGMWAKPWRLTGLTLCLIYCQAGCSNDIKAERDAQAQRAAMAEQAASENAAHIQMLLQDSARLAEMAATVSSVDAVLSLQTISDTNDGASCFDGSNIGIDLKLQSELDTLTFWNPSLGATVSRQADGSIHLNFRLSPTESGFAKAGTQQAGRGHHGSRPCDFAVWWTPRR